MLTGVRPEFHDYNNPFEIESRYAFLKGDREHNPQFTTNGNPLPDEGLPIVPTLLDNKFPHKVKFVFEPPTIVALDTDSIANNNPRFVPANGGYDHTVTYTSKDAEQGVLKEDKQTIVSAGDTRIFKANAPAGLLFNPVFQHPATMQNNAFDERTQIALAPLTEGWFVMPIVYQDDNSKYDFKVGDYIAPDNPSAADLINNPNAKVGGFRVWVEAEDNTIADTSTIDRRNMTVYGKQKDSIRQAVAKVISVVDIDSVSKDRSVFNTIYKTGTTRDENMVSKFTNGFDTTYWNAWKKAFQEKATNNKYELYEQKAGYKCKLVFAIIGKR